MGPTYSPDAAVEAAHARFEDRDLDQEQADLTENLWAREWAAEDDLERHADLARDEYLMDAS